MSLDSPAVSSIAHCYVEIKVIDQNVCITCSLFLSQIIGA